MKLRLFLCGSIAATSTAFQVFSTVRTPSRIAATVSIDEGVDRDIDGLNSWASQNGVIKMNGFNLKQDAGDWSVMTTVACQGGTRVLQVPSNLILSSTRARQDIGDVDAALAHLSSKGVQDQISQFYLFLKVLREYEKGEESAWHPWMQSLPRLFYNSVSMTDFCYEILPPFVYSLSKIERIKFDIFFEALQFVVPLFKETRENHDLAKWAFSVVYTRCWGTDGGETQIVPMADMFNHGHPAEIAINYDSDGNCNMFVKNDVPAGSPLRLSYGSPTNPSRLLATFGFLDESSPASFCKIMARQPSQELLDVGYDFSRMLFYKEDGAISEEVWDVMLFSLLDQNPEVQKVFYEAHMKGDRETKVAIHGQFFLDTASALKTHVDTLLLELEELKKKTVGKDPSKHPRLPIIMKHNEFVKQTFLKVQARLDPMVIDETERRKALGEL